MNTFVAELISSWLTDTLHTHGFLSRGQAISIEISNTVEYVHSQHVYFRATYSSDAPPSAPQRLFVKLTKPHALNAARREARFYTMIAPRLQGIALAPCYGTGTTSSGIPYLLLAELSSTHDVWTGPLFLPQLEPIIALLAQLHASTWDRAELVPLLDRPPEQTLRALFEDAEQNYAELAGKFGFDWPFEYRRVFEHYVTVAPVLFHERLQRGTALMLCHPDNSASNFLFPLQANAPISLIDWHVYRYWWGGVDIAALIMRSAPSELQSQGEQLVRTYHTRLQEQGVVDYTWDACWYDYCLGMIDTLRVVLAQRRNPGAALQTMTTLVDALHRHDCLDLLG